VCDVRCTVRIGHCWDSLGIVDAGVCNHASLSERGGCKIFMSGWAAPYFFPGNMACIEDEVSPQNRADSPQRHVGALELESIQ